MVAMQTSENIIKIQIIKKTEDSNNKDSSLKYFRHFRHFLTLVPKPLPQFLVVYFFAVH
jgi:hypothetical protein